MSSRVQPLMICAWCPGFVPAAGESHGMCPACAVRFEAALVARKTDTAPEPDVDDDDDDRDELLGSTCGAACGHCGRCS